MTTAMQSQRMKQVSSLRTHFPGMQEIVKDSDYQIRFKNNFGTEYTAYIQLPFNFPNERPIVMIHPPIEHPWVDWGSSSVVGCRQLNEFSMHQDVGKVLEALVKELSTHKPNGTQHSFDSSQLAETRRYTPATMFNNASMPEPANGAYHPPSAAPTTLNPPANLESEKWIKGDVIEGLDVEVLRDLNASNDDGALLEYVDLEGFQREGASERVRLLQENLELAQENLKFQPLLEQGRLALGEKQAKMGQLLDEFHRKEEEQSALSQFSEFRVMKSLGDLATQDSDQAENLAEEFQKGEVGLDRFLTEFREKKESSYLRNAKQMKIHRILSDDRNLQQFTAPK